MIWMIASNKGHADITKPEELTFERLVGVDYVFFPFWSWKIPKEIYEYWECVIFHMTDLPYGRGGNPLQNLIIRGHKNTKISAIKCVEEIDAGPVYMKVDLNLDGTADEIYDRADKIIREQMIPFIINNKPIPIPQEDEPVYFERWNCSFYDVIRSLDTNRIKAGKAGIANLFKNYV